MDYKSIFDQFQQERGITPLNIVENRPDEAYAEVKPCDFNALCSYLHKRLNSPVMMFFADDETSKNGNFRMYCVFEGIEQKKWFFVVTDIPAESACFNSLSKEIYSANLFEREMKEMFGLQPIGNPDTRRLNLHGEVWPEGNYPLRKNFNAGNLVSGPALKYNFKKIEGEGVFQVPVGPVHAGIIGPGHFRFSCAGEPIINLDIRLGFTHRGVEKLFENKAPHQAVALSECVSGDSAFAHSLAFCSAVEKTGSIQAPVRAQYIRCIFLELERMYNHVSGIGGIALDVGFSFPAAFASTIKESLLVLNEKLTDSRYLKKVNLPGGVMKDIDGKGAGVIVQSMDSISEDFMELKKMLFSSVSFMDRVDGTGVLQKKIAEDLGTTGLAARASAIRKDLRKSFPGAYKEANFNMVSHTRGDVLSRLNVRIEEFEESEKIIRQVTGKLPDGDIFNKQEIQNIKGYSLGYAEGWRGPVLYWVKIDENGTIGRCKIVDPSFHNWQGLSYAAPGNIIPDFPLCNKSFDLSYSGNDL